MLLQLGCLTGYTPPLELQTNKHGRREKNEQTDIYLFIIRVDIGMEESLQILVAVAAAALLVLPIWRMISSTCITLR